jgi:hypothetical protein
MKHMVGYLIVVVIALYVGAKFGGMLPFIKAA